MDSTVLPDARFSARQAVKPEDVPACPRCGGPLRPWGVWRSQGGQLADCPACLAFFGVVLLPEVLYAQVDATLGVWHASVHDLPTPVQTDAPEVIPWRERQPPAGALRARCRLEDDPKERVGDWCRVALRYHWGDYGPDDVLDDVEFLLAFREEDLAFEASEPIPKGTYGTENPDSDLAPDRFRLRFGVALVDHLARAHGRLCWRALEAIYLASGAPWTSRMESARGYNLLVPFVLRSPMPEGLSEDFQAFVDAKFRYRPGGRNIGS